MRLRTCVLLLALLAPALLHAQETLVPIDSAGSLERIDAELESRLGLFPDISGFQEARLYAGADGAFVLEITYASDGRQQRSRRTMNASDAQAFRQQVTDRMRERAAPPMLDQEGRALFITGTTTLGLSYYGLAAIQATGAEDKAAVAVYMLTAATGFFAPYLLTQKTQVTKAQAKLSLYGFAAGAVHGHLLHAVASGEAFDETQGSFAMGMGMGLAEGLAGYYLADAHDLSEGKVDVITSLATFGLGFGAGTTYLVGGEGDVAFAGGTLLGAVAGFAAGNAVANMQNYSSGDATVMTTTGVVGAWTPVAILLLADLEGDDDAIGRIYTASAMAGAVGGIALGHHLVKGRQFTDAQGNYVALGTAATTAVALGLAYLIGSEDADYRLYVGASLAGSVGGLALMYGLLEDDAPRELGANLRLHVSPSTIGAFALGRRPSGSASVPMMGVSYTF